MKYKVPSTTNRKACNELQAFLFVVLKHRSYRGLRPQTPASFQDDPPLTCPEIGLQIEYEQCKLYLGHQWNRN